MSLLSKPAVVAAETIRLSWRGRGFGAAGPRTGTGARVLAGRALAQGGQLDKTILTNFCAVQEKSMGSWNWRRGEWSGKQNRCGRMARGKYDS